MNNVISEPLETTSATDGPTGEPGWSDQPEPRRLTRGEGPMAGVCGGLADYLGQDPTLVRLGIVGATLLTFPLGVVAYIAAWLIIPEA